MRFVLFVTFFLRCAFVGFYARSSPRSQFVSSSAVRFLPRTRALVGWLFRWFTTCRVAFLITHTFTLPLRVTYHFTFTARYHCTFFLRLVSSHCVGWLPLRSVRYLLRFGCYFYVLTFLPRVRLPHYARLLPRSFTVLTLPHFLHYVLHTHYAPRSLLLVSSGLFVTRRATFVYF